MDSTKASATGEACDVRGAALGVLRAVARSLRGALGHAADGAYRTRPPPFDPALPFNHTGSAAALSYPPPPGGVAQGAGASSNHALRSGGSGCAAAAAGAEAVGAVVAAMEALPLPTLPAAHLIAITVIPLLSDPIVAAGPMLTPC